MLRTIGVWVAGTLLGFVLLGSLFWASIGLPWPLRIYAYYVAEAVTGTAVGLFVGLLQKRSAGIVALVCLIPPAYLQYVNRFAPPATGLRLVLLLLGTFIALGIAFALSQRLSKPRRAVH